MRYRVLDYIRGINLISMILYHLLWDLVYLYGIDLGWYQSHLGYFWQQSICCTFIMLSGFCWSIGKRKLKRGLIISGAGILVSVVTLVMMPDIAIIFGILTLLGSCTLMLVPLEKILRKIPVGIGFLGSMTLFIVLKQINKGYIGIGQTIWFSLPTKLYQGYFMTYIGFTDSHFSSTDYFSLFPWLFLFIAGYYLYGMISKRELLKLKQANQMTWIEYIGRKSIWVYLIHQPIIYFITLLCFKFFY